MRRATTTQYSLATSMIAIAQSVMDSWFEMGFQDRYMYADEDVDSIAIWMNFEVKGCSLLVGTLLVR
jgi:hypothetical protein